VIGGKEVNGWKWIFRKHNGINHSTSAVESKRDAKIGRQAVDDMGGEDQDFNGGWQEVKRKHRGSKHESLHQPSLAPHPVQRYNKPRITDFDKVMRDKATSFFFINFPDSWDSSALWKAFNRYGKVVDVYIAFKRTKMDNRFGFVRFINTSDVEAFERRLKGIIIGNSNLVINRARFNKVGGADVRPSDFPPIKQSGHGQTKKKSNLPPRSFKEAFLGSRQIPTKMIKIEEDKGIRSRLECCWTGKAKNLHVAQNEWNIVDNNGLVDCKVRYVGGLSFHFEWKSKEVAGKNLEDNWVWLQQWFDDIKPWDGSESPVGRLVWLNVEGLPSLGRHIGVVKAIVKDFGRVLEVGRLNFEAKILPPVKTLMLVQCIEEISQSVTVSLNEEFVGPSMAVDGGGEDCSADHDSQLGETKESHVQSPCSKFGVPRSPQTSNNFSSLPSELPSPPSGPDPAQTSIFEQVVKPTPSFEFDSSIRLDVNSPKSVKSISDINMAMDLETDVNKDDKELEDLLCSF
ncbi:nucleotide-binding alpha-beta plait domain-containing protein, partial [Tanacetum coccineum]